MHSRGSQSITKASWERKGFVPLTCSKLAWKLEFSAQQHCLAFSFTHPFFGAIKMHILLVITTNNLQWARSFFFIPFNSIFWEIAEEKHRLNFYAVGAIVQVQVHKNKYKLRINFASSLCLYSSQKFYKLISAGEWRLREDKEGVICLGFVKA